MATSRVFNILVAEDEGFQRLALLDILTLCDYEAVAVENGALALAELKAENIDYDLVLLDLYMPAMDGFELLSIMKNDDRLKHIPVVVMSANDTNEIIAGCLKMGAKDYMVKPIRYQECKGLVRHMKQISLNPAEQQMKGLQKYEMLSSLGKGAAGEVSLVRNKVDGQQYALKKINLLYLNEKDKKQAENEAQFLQVLQGPTLISFIEAFTENNNINIVMEYADGGNLGSKIQKFINTGKKFTTDQILRYIAQITLGVMAMHSKNILHRDIKTQNIFISQGDILKLGDFGISKQVETLNANNQTACGTPYFMAPEVCQGKPYDSKADVWAVGVILYELVTLKKPFDSETINGVFEKIKYAQLDPLPEEVDSNIKMLVASLLNKDYNKRPSSFEIAKIPCIKKQIKQFVEENKCGDAVLGIFEMEDRGGEHDQKTPGQSAVKSTKTTGSIQRYQLEQLEVWAELIRNDIKIADYKNGWFATHLRCAQGADIYKWIIEHVDNDDEKNAKNICQKMLEKEIIQSVEGKIEFSTHELYRLYMDRDDIADNLVRKWKDEVKGALEVSVNLVAKIDEVYEQAVTQEDDQTTFDIEAALKSTQYKGYLIAASELERVNISILTQREKIAFFLNVYQCMYIHHFLRMCNEGKGPGTQQSYFTKLKSIVWDYSSKPFYYNIGGLNFSLDDIKHGLLRGNKKSPHAYMKNFGWSDPRRSLLQELNDARINFICLDFPDFVEHIDSFPSEDELSNKIDEFVSEIINAKASYDSMQGEFTLPKVLQTYKDDFGGSDQQILNFVFKYFQSSEIDEESAIREICERKSIMIRFE